MAKFKNITGELVRFDLNGKTKAVEAGHAFQAEPNDYLEGAVALGLFEQVSEPDSAAEPAKASETSKSRN